MTSEQRQQCKQQLLQIQKKHQALEAEFAKSGNTDTVILDQSSVGRLSRMDAMQGQQMALEASRRREMQSEKLEGSLRRVESSDFGTCFYCEEEIDFKRMEADPTNTRCVKCAALDTFE